MYVVSHHISQIHYFLPYFLAHIHSFISITKTEAGIFWVNAVYSPCIPRRRGYIHHTCVTLLSKCRWRKYRNSLVINLLSLLVLICWNQQNIFAIQKYLKSKLEFYLCAFWHSIFRFAKYTYRLFHLEYITQICAISHVKFRNSPFLNEAGKTKIELCG